MKLDAKKMEHGVRLILQGMNVDLNDSNFIDTPKRVAKMYVDMLTPPANNWAEFPAPSGGMIVLRAHRVFALCPHHLLPVKFKAFVAYIPNKKVLGLSKLARVVESQLTKPIMQEELAELTAQALYEKLEPQGVAVVLSGVHGCMEVRGVETTGDVVTSSLRGLFLHAQTTRDEFYRIIQGQL